MRWGEQSFSGLCVSSLMQKAPCLTRDLVASPWASCCWGASALSFVWGSRWPADQMMEIPVISMKAARHPLQSNCRTKCSKIKHIFIDASIHALVPLSVIDKTLRIVLWKWKAFSLWKKKSFFKHRIKEEATLSIYKFMLFLPIWSKKIIFNQCIFYLD